MWRKAQPPGEADLGEPDVCFDGDWFIASYRGERIGRFAAREHAEKMWRRWARSYASGVTSPAGSWNTVPRATRNES